MKKYKIEVYDLFFEVTRRCNMTCSHCLRGCSENIDISTEIIDKTLEQVSEITNITFTGGEPSLNPAAIRHAYNTIKRKDIPLLGFFIVTNGLLYSDDFMGIILDLYAYCVNVGSEDCCSICLSIDQFHNDIPPENILKYKALSFYSDTKEAILKENDILKEGLAYENGIGEKNPTCKTEITEYSFQNDVLCIYDDIYINAKGDVILGCDVSYENQEELKIGNILEESLESIILKNIKPKGKKKVIA